MCVLPFFFWRGISKDMPSRKKGTPEKKKKKRRLPRGFEVKHVPRTMPLFSRSFHKDKQAPASDSPTWLAFEKGYGSATSYGPHIFRHTLVRKLRLLDVGKKAVRRAVGLWADKNIRRDTSGACRNLPGEEVLNLAWGEGCNHPAAVLVCAVCRALHLDGWLARDWDEEDMEGPEEVMLCKPALLQSSTRLEPEPKQQHVVDLTALGGGRVRAQ